MAAQPAKAPREAMRCVRDIRHVPSSAYRLAKDKRKWRSICGDRKELTTLLATYANGDGAGAYPSIKTMMDATGWSHGKVCYVLTDLAELGFVTKGQRVGKHGTTNRTINTAVIVGVQDSGSKSKIEPVSESKIDSSESNLDSSESKKPPIVGHDRPGVPSKRENSETRDAKTVSPAHSPFSEKPSRNKHSPSVNPQGRALVDLAIQSALETKIAATFRKKDRAELADMFVEHQVTQREAEVVAQCAVRQLDEFECRQAGNILCAKFVPLLMILRREEAERAAAAVKYEQERPEREARAAREKQQSLERATTQRKRDYLRGQNVDETALNDVMNDPTHWVWEHYTEETGTGQAK